MMMTMMMMMKYHACKKIDVHPIHDKIFACKIEDFWPLEVKNVLQLWK